jgi:ATP-binding cassette, subfamily B, bacterial PglK
MMSSRSSGFVTGGSAPRSYPRTVAALLRVISPRRRVQLVGIMVLMLLSGAAEVVTLGAVLPLLGFLSGGSGKSAGWIGEVIRYVGHFPGLDVASVLTMVFASAALFTGAIRILLVYATARFSSSIGFELGSEVFRRAVEQPYEEYLTQHSSEVLAALGKVDAVVSSLMSVLYMMTGVCISFLIVSALMFIDVFTTVATVATLGIAYSAFPMLARKRVTSNSRLLNQAGASRLKLSQEVLGGMRDVVLGHTREVFITEFDRISYSIYRARASNDIIGPTPRFVVEALGMVIIAALAYSLAASQGGMSYALPTIGALALGLQRLLPLVQQTYHGFVGLASTRYAVTDVLALVSESRVRDMDYSGSALPFERQVELRRVSFSYPAQNHLVLVDISMGIPKGARVGIVGQTGSGKSTLVDLIMGLLSPDKGVVLVDGSPLEGKNRFAWQMNIAHVPQEPFLLDASFLTNIAFGTRETIIDLDRIKRAARDAQLSEFIDQQPQGYYTKIGERGIGLSGGQRQRIAIARALYKGASVLVLDEATSALDDQTEEAVMKAIDGLGRDLTIVVIAHRIDTLQSCDIFFRVENGRVAEISAQELGFVNYQTEHCAALLRSDLTEVTSRT